MVTPRARVGYALVLTAAVLFAVNGGVSKVVLEAGVQPARLTALRVTGALVGLVALTLLTGPRRLRVSVRELPMLATYGVVGVALIQWFYFVAIDRLPVGIAVLLEFTGPVLVAVYARVVLKEAVRRRMWLALALSLGGLALVAQVWRGSELDSLGVLAGIGAAFALATYYLLGQHAVRTRDPLSLTTWTFLFGAVFWAVLQPWWRFQLAALADAATLPGGLDEISAPLWLLLGWVIVLGTLVPFLLSVAALQHIPATRAGVVGTSEPVFAAVVGWVWLGQALTAVQMLGGVLVLAGVGLAQTARAGARVPAPVPEKP